MTPDVNEQSEPHTLPGNTLHWLLDCDTPNGSCVRLQSMMLSGSKLTLELEVSPETFLRDVLNSYEARRYDLEAPARTLQQLKSTLILLYDRLEKLAVSNPEVAEMLRVEGAHLRPVLTELWMREDPCTRSG